MSTIREFETAAQAKLEPEALYLDLDSAVRLSLAISMKRIADVLNYDPSVPENLFDVIRGIRDR
jgi:hypothetical protein